MYILHLTLKSKLILVINIC